MNSIVAVNQDNIKHLQVWTYKAYIDKLRLEARESKLRLALIVYIIEEYT